MAVMRERSAPLEPELHEGDGKVAAWVWVTLGAIVLAAILVAPFQLFWPFSG